jgi:uncharacterized protein with HEPN domain
MSKIIKTVSRKIPELLTKARAIYTSLTNHPSFQEKSAAFHQDVQRLGEAIDRLQKAFDEAMSRDSQKISFRNIVRDELVVILGRVAMHVELAAMGDPTLLRASGFDMAQERSGKGGAAAAVLQAPELRLKHGPLPGVLIAYAKPVRYAASYELVITDGDPSIEENYKVQGVHAHCTKIEVPGCTAGANYWAKMRCIGPRGAGPWSAPVTIMSL